MRTAYLFGYLLRQYALENFQLDICRSVNAWTVRMMSPEQRIECRFAWCYSLIHEGYRFFLASVFPEFLRHQCLDPFAAISLEFFLLDVKHLQ